MFSVQAQTHFKINKPRKTSLTFKFQCRRFNPVSCLSTFIVYYPLYSDLDSVWLSDHQWMRQKYLHIFFTLVKLSQYTFSLPKSYNSNSWYHTIHPWISEYLEKLAKHLISYSPSPITYDQNKYIYT